MSGLIDRRLIVVTGKGGTGKTTVAAALGLLAARRGKRTVVAEVARRTDVAGALGAEAGEPFAEVEIAPGLSHVSIDPQDAMEEYLADQLPSRTLADLLGSSRTFGLLAAATPGLRELLSVGKVWELAQAERRTPGARAYDLVVLDAPATGHGLATLTAPRAFSQAARVGPVARQGRIIHEWLTDPRRTGVVAVARPEELPVGETVALADGLREQLGLALDAVVVNAVGARRLSADEVRRLEEATGVRALSPAAALAVRRALGDHAVARVQRAQVERLRRAVPAPRLTLPVCVEPATGHADLPALADALERELARRA